MAHENLAGRSIAGYRLLERVGEGGTATVYRAEHDVHGRCAVKTLRERLRNDPTAVRRFLREAEYGSRVRHPHVVRTYDYGDTDGLYYLALEWAEGAPLAEHVARRGRLAAQDVAHIVEQLAGALAAAHAEGIIHRDLKPQNIIYDASTRTAKLLDFGIARDAQEDPAERLTRTGFFVGTLQYVAPEALSGALVGEAADIYSLATITYYLLTGVHPYATRSPRELFQKLLTEPPTRLNEAVRGLPFSSALERAVMKGLAREGAHRQASVLDFAADVRRGVSETSAPAPMRRGILGVLGSIIGRKR